MPPKLPDRPLDQPKVGLIEIEHNDQFTAVDEIAQ